MFEVEMWLTASGAIAVQINSLAVGFGVAASRLLCNGVWLRADL